MATITFTVQSVRKRYDLFAEVIGHKITCDNSKFKKDLRKIMEIRGIFPISLDVGDIFKVDVVKKIDNRTSTPYLDIIGEPKRILLEKSGELAKFLRTKINVADKDNPKLQKWKLSLKTSNDIVSCLGLDCIQKIIDNPIQLLNYPHLKLNDDKVFEMQRILQRNANLQKIALVLQASQLTMKTILFLYDTYGEKTLSVIQDNPYQICYEEKISFQTADRLAFDLNFNQYDSIRIKTAIIEFMKNKKVCGNVCILKNQFYQSYGVGQQTFNQFLNKIGYFKDNNVSNEFIEEILNELISDNKLILEKDSVNNEYIYLPELYGIEENLIYQTHNILSNTYNQKFCDESEIDDFLQYYETTYNIQLDILQKEAVKNTLLNKMSILTGGPGTGKTATVSVIVAAIKYISLKKYNKDGDFKLLAPTGKAAERMMELTNESSSTIHRGLCISYQNTIPEELDADFAIIDECSMIDIYLMNNLLSAITERTRILFVGDVNQLPSVGPGKVLSEFISSGKIKYVRLQTIFRQSQNSAIVSNANKIILGKTSNEINGVDLSNDKNKNFKFIRDTSIEGIKKHLLSKIDEYLNNGINLSNICILTPMRKGELGVENLNSILQDIYNSNPIAYENEELGIAFKVGDKIIQTKNNYDLNVFNGYIGTIIEIDENRVVNGTLKPSITVEYDNMDIPVLYEGENIQQLELAYVLTVHKSQGSEYPYVISPIHNEQNILLNRNLLYTNVTRAKTEFCLIGDENAVNKAIKTELSEFERISLIAEKIFLRC